MTQIPTAPSETSTPAEPVAQVQLRAARSLTEFRVLAVIYLALIAAAWAPLAIAGAMLMPLFCVPTHPRRALWLWAVGLLSGVMSIVGARALMASLGGFNDALSQAPTQAWLAIGWAVLGVAVVVWQLTWVKSPRRMA